MENRLRRIMDSSSGETSYIGSTLTIEGNFRGQGNLIVKGNVIGDCELEGTVTLSESGSWSGTLAATHIVVAGKVEGNIVANGQLEIASTAKIDGHLTGSRIAVAQGAVVEGSMKVLSGEPAKSFEEKRSR